MHLGRLTSSVCQSCTISRPARSDAFLALYPVWKTGPAVAVACVKSIKTFYQPERTPMEPRPFPDYYCPVFRGHLEYQRYTGLWRFGSISPRRASQSVVTAEYTDRMQASARSMCKGGCGNAHIADWKYEYLSHYSTVGPQGHARTNRPQQQAQQTSIPNPCVTQTELSKDILSLLSVVHPILQLGA